MQENRVKRILRKGGLVLGTHVYRAAGRFYRSRCGLSPGLTVRLAEIAWNDLTSRRASAIR